MNSENSHIDYIAAHKHSTDHYDDLMASSVCGCFYCLRTFSPLSITRWIDENPPKPHIASIGQTALCPHCGIDSVIGSATGYPITREFLQKMHEYWFKG